MVSGLARGIDTAAHQACLMEGGVTVAVMGTGLDRVYPSANRELARRILARGGALISQFPAGTPARRENFPKRNWLIAHLCHAVVVVEAATRSGALITAGAALHLGREVLAVPGSILGSSSAGCHALLRDGAGLALGPAEILTYAGFDPGPEGCDEQEPKAPMDPELEALLSELLGVAPGWVATRLGVSAAEALARLTRLELAGRAARGPDGYRRAGCGRAGRRPG